MPQVTVDLDDLEALVWGSGAIKAIEASLASFRRDPFTPNPEVISQAHERLATAVRQAKRDGAGTAVDFNEPLTSAELKLLRKTAVNAAATHKRGAPFPVTLINTKDKVGDYDRLAAKGCIVIGTTGAAFVFPGQKDPLLIIEPNKLGVMITPRGSDRLDETATKQIAAQKS